MKKTTNYIALITLLSTTVLTACEYSLIDKDKSSHLFDAQQFYYEQGNINRAQTSYQEAFTSTDSDVRARAAYALAQLAHDQENFEEQIGYLEAAFDSGHGGSKLPLARSYIRYKQTPAALREAETILLAKEKLEFGDLLLLVQLYTLLEENDQATHYLYKAGRSYDADIDDDGKVAMKLAHLHQMQNTDVLNSLSWLRTSWIKGYEPAGLRLARYHLQYSPQDSAEYNEAVAILSELAQKDNVTAINTLAQSYAAIGDYERMQQWYDRLEELTGIKRGAPSNKPQFELVYDHLRAGTKESLAEAQNLLQDLAARFESVHAMMLLDSLSRKRSASFGSYYRNTSVEELEKIVRKHERYLKINKPTIIKRLLVLAADYGSANSALKIARQYSSAENSMQWHMKAAKLGSTDAMLYVARTHSVDITNEASAQRAFYWFKEAAKSGDVEGQYYTGLYYARGIGVEKNIKQAKLWLSRADKNGYKQASVLIDSL